MPEIIFTKLYERWKRTDLFEVASETMPKQANKNKVLDELRRQHCEYTEDLSEETWTAAEIAHAPLPEAHSETSFSFEVAFFARPLSTEKKKQKPSF